MLLKVGNTVKINQDIEGQYRPNGTHPDYTKVYTLMDTDGDRAIVKPQDGIGGNWVVSYAALVYVV